VQLRRESRGLRTADEPKELSLGPRHDSCRVEEGKRPGKSSHRGIGRIQHDGRGYEEKGRRSRRCDIEPEEARWHHSGGQKAAVADHEEALG
jgi:hypothetical protein